MRSPTPLVRHISILSTLVASGALAAPEPLARLMPDVRLVGWHAVGRSDARHLPATGERELAPLDRGLALYLSWALQPTARRSPTQVLRDGSPLDDTELSADGDAPGELGRVDPLAELDPGPDDPNVWADPTDDWLGETWPPPPGMPPDDGAEGRSTLPIEHRAGAVDPAAAADRRAALQAARRALSRADGARARRRARVDVDEARARVEIVDPRFRASSR